MSNSNPNGEGKEVKAVEKPKDSKKEEMKEKQARAEAKRQLRKAGKGNLSDKLPAIGPHIRCRLRLLRTERVKDFLMLEREFITSSAGESEEDKYDKDGDPDGKSELDDEELKTEKREAAIAKMLSGTTSLKGPVGKGDESHLERAAEQRKLLNRLRGGPLFLGELDELVDDTHGIISQQGMVPMYMAIMSFVDREELVPGCTVLVNESTHCVVGLLTENSNPLVNVMKVDKAPSESYADIGGLDEQIMEVKEAVELPLTHPELYDEIGIQPPKGVILYGPPGTGKTLLAKAVANQTSATFIRITGSELIKKYSGEGPKLVRDLFRAAADNAPSIIFIDEIDAVGTKRYEAHSSGEREIQRTMLELLNQLDGFDARGDVKVIIATNRIDSLDPALIRPGRIDRKIEIPLPDESTKRRIFQIHTQKMTLGEEVDLEEFVMSKDELSGADIKAICTEAGLLALRERRMKVTQDDFRRGKERVLYRKEAGTPKGLYS